MLLSLQHGPQAWLVWHRSSNSHRAFICKLGGLGSQPAFRLYISLALGSMLCCFGLALGMTVGTTSKEVPSRFFVRAVIAAFIAVAVAGISLESGQTWVGLSPFCQGKCGCGWCIIIVNHKYIIICCSPHFRRCISDGGSYRSARADNSHITTELSLWLIISRKTSHLSEVEILASWCVKEENLGIEKVVSAKISC